MKINKSLCKGCRYALVDHQINDWTGSCIQQNFTARRKYITTLNPDGSLTYREETIPDSGRDDVPRSCPRWLEQMVISEGGAHEATL